MVDTYFKEKDAIEVCTQPVEFESDNISWNIPEFGVTTSDKRWTIKPRSHPQVIK